MKHKALPLLQEMLDESAMWQHPDIPFRASVTPGLENVLVVAGDNCSGKSFLVEMLRGWIRHYKLDSVVVSIRERSGGGPYEMASMRRAMMFGDETDQSTGAISAGVIERAFTTLNGRAQENVASLLVLDEPELGLSESMAGALGEYLAQQALEMAETAVGLAVVTHSRPLVQRMVEALGQAPTFAYMRDAASASDAEALGTWLAVMPRCSVEDLKNLRVSNRDNQRKVNAILEDLKKASKKKTSPAS